VNPLDNFPLIRSRNIEEVRETIGQIYAKPVLVPARGVGVFDTTINYCRLQTIDFAYRAFGAQTGLEYPESEFVVLKFPIRGSGEITFGRTSVAVAAGIGAVIPSDVTHKSNYSADYAHLALRLRSRVLIEKLSAMTGMAINEPLRIDPQQNSDDLAVETLRQYLPLLFNTLSEATPPFPDWWIAQTEQFVMALLLCGHRHNYSHLLEQDTPDAGWRLVRQAEEYIEANAQRAITLEEIAAVIGVSTLTLVGSFKKYRGYSPMKFLSQVRARQR
jgi:hypothetical protein